MSERERRGRMSERERRGRGGRERESGGERF